MIILGRSQFSPSWCYLAGLEHFLSQELLREVSLSRYSQLVILCELDLCGYSFPPILSPVFHHKTITIFFLTLILKEIPNQTLLLSSNFWCFHVASEGWAAVDCEQVTLRTMMCQKLAKVNVKPGASLGLF